MTNSFSTWVEQVRALFPVKEEYELADAIYSFHAAFLDGMTPQEAYADFDSWVAAA